MRTLAAMALWRPISTAHRNGKLICLLVDYRDGDRPLEDDRFARTVGFNNLENDGDDEWKFAGWCWEHDHFTEGRGRPVAWADFPSVSDEYKQLIIAAPEPQS